MVQKIKLSKSLRKWASFINEDRKRIMIKLIRKKQSLVQKKDKKGQEPIVNGKKPFSLPFNMLKRNPPKVFKGEVLWGTYDLETITIPIAEIPEKYRDVLLDLYETPSFSDAFFSVDRKFDPNNSFSIQIPIAYGLAYKKTINIVEDYSGELAEKVEDIKSVSISENSSEGDTNTQNNGCSGENKEKTTTEVDNTGIINNSEEKNGNRQEKTDNVEELKSTEFVYDTFSSDNPVMDYESIIQYSFKVMEDFFNKVYNLYLKYGKEYKYFFLYAHNGGRYDSLICFYFHLKLNASKIFGKQPKLIKKDNAVLSLKLGNNIELRDSMKLLSGSLESLGQKMVGRGKLEMQVKRFTLQNVREDGIGTVSWKTLADYVKQDTILLYEILEVFEVFLKDFFKVEFYEKLTLPSLTVHIYFKDFYNPFFIKEKKKWINGICALNKEQESKIRESYHGGRTEIFKPKLEKGKIFDLNSAYVATMIEKPLPSGTPKGPFPVLNDLGFFHYELDSFFGFAEATVFSFADFTKRFVLPHKMGTGNLCFPGGRFSGWFFSEELKLAKKFGYIILVKQTIRFDKSNYMFRKYLTKLAQVRENYDKSHPYNTLAKLLGNGLYGRFAMRVENNPHYVAFNDSDVRKIIKKADIKELFVLHDLENNEIYSIDTQKKTSGITYDPRSSKYIVKQLHQKVAPQISAAVSSYVRIQLAETLNKDVALKIGYVDTDSIFVEGDFTPRNVDNNKIGYWKLESEFEKAYIFAQKFYYLLLINEKTNEIAEKMKVRGASSAYRKDLAIERLEKLLEKDPQPIVIEGSTADFRTILQADSKNFMMLEKPKTISIGSTAVEQHTHKIFDQEGKWVSCEPYIIVDNKTTTLAKYAPLYAEMKVLVEEQKQLISKEQYFKNKKIHDQYLKAKFQVQTFEQDPTNLPCPQKIDNKTGRFKKKTFEELVETKKLDLEKYQVLQALKTIKETETRLPNKTRLLMEQLEIYVYEFIKEHQCLEEEVEAKLVEMQSLKNSEIEENFSFLLENNFNNKDIYNKLISLLERKKTLLLKQLE